VARPPAVAQRQSLGDIIPGEEKGGEGGGGEDGPNTGGNAAKKGALAENISVPLHPESLASEEGKKAAATSASKKVAFDLSSFSTTSSASRQPMLSLAPERQQAEGGDVSRRSASRASNVFFNRNRTGSVLLQDRLARYKEGMPDFRRREILTSRPRNERHCLNEIVSILIQRRSALDEMNGIEAAIRYLVHKDNDNETAFNKRAQRIW
jgi:hypothetical protein